MKKYLEVGKIVGVHGLRGTLKVQPWCDTPEFLCDFDFLYLDEGKTQCCVQSAGVHKRVVLLNIAGVDSAEKAERMRGQVLYIDREDAPLEDGAHFIQDLLGLSVMDADTGEEYGKIAEIFQTGANDVYTVRAADGKEYLVPAIDDVVKEIDVNAKRVLICPLKGIFDDEN